jgi:TELO2-interacting protein 1
MFFRSLLEEYLQPKYWNLPVTGQIDDHASNPAETSLLAITGHPLPVNNAAPRSIEQLNSNIVLICLLLDGIEQCSLILGADFQIHLIDVLYPILEKVGSENAKISRCALRCLHSMSKSTGSGSVSALLQNNSDYLVNSISLKLRHIKRHPEAPTVLQVALHHGNITMLPLVNDLILEVSSLHVG